MFESAVVFDVPLNTTRVYTMVTDNYGTEIYIPCISPYDAESSKEAFQEFLDSQPEQDKIIS